MFLEIQEYIQTYNSLPSENALRLQLEARANLTESEFRVCKEILAEINTEEASKDTAWLFNATEKFCQEKAIYNAIMESIQILDGKDVNKSKGSIPSLLSDALSVSFN